MLKKVSNINILDVLFSKIYINISNTKIKKIYIFI